MNRRAFSSLAVLVALASCSPDLHFLEDSLVHADVEASISGGDVSVLFSSDAGSTSLELEATGKWTASFAEGETGDWCTLSTDSGNRGKAIIKITVKSNPDYDQRSTTINFVCGKSQKRIVVTQRQKDALIISTSRVDVEPEGGSFSIGIDSNISFDCKVSESCNSWIIPNGTRAMSTSNYSFKVTKNDIPEQRTGWIIINNDELKITDSVRVVQAFVPIVVPCESLKASCNGWIVSFETSGPDLDDYKVVSDSPWLSLVKRETVSGRCRFTVNVQPLDDKSRPREGTVSVYFKDYPVPDVVNIHQYEQLPTFSYTTSSSTVTIPSVEGEDVWGFVFWGDDSQELYSDGLTHRYQSSGSHLVTVEVSSKELVPINGLEDGMRINLRGLRK